MGTRATYLTKSGKLIPKKLVDEFVLHEKFFMLNDEPYYYENGSYINNENWISQELTKYLPDHLISTRNLNEVESLINRTTTARITIDDVNKEKDVINLKNCLISFSDDSYQIKEHTPSFLSTQQFNVKYKKNYSIERWESFLSSCLSRDDRNLLQEIMGYLLVPETCAKKMFILHGPPDCGKSTIIEIIRNIIDIKNFASIDPSFLQPEYQFYAYELFGKLVNGCGDISDQQIDPAMLKQLLGEDIITANRKNKDCVQFKNTARCIFSCNNMPPSKDNTEGWHRKLIIMDFKAPNKKDNKLKGDLLKELDGIFMWTLDGLLRLRKNNYVFSESKESKNALDEYRRSNDSALAFIEDRLELGPGYMSKSKNVFCAYLSYCKENAITNPMTNIAFFKKLKKRNIIKKVLWIDGKSVNGIEGAKLSYNKLEREAIRNE